MSNANKKQRKKINVIDVIVILLVLALIGTAVYKIYSEVNSSPSNKKSNYIVAFESDLEYRSLLSYLKNGDAVYFSTNGTLFGYLYDDPSDDVGAVYELAAEDDTASDSETDEVNTESDPYSKTKIGGNLKLVSNAIRSKSGEYYTVEEINISVGSTVEVYTAKAVFTLTVKSITSEAQ